MLCFRLLRNLLVSFLSVQFHLPILSVCTSLRPLISKVESNGVDSTVVKDIQTNSKIFCFMYEVK
jgi:hypothetical protein